MNDRVDAPSDQRMRRIIATANDGFIALDAQGTITDWNRQAELIFGWPREAALGLPLAETIIPLQYRDAHREGLRRFLATGEGPIFEKRLELSALHRDGHEFPIELTVWPIRIGAAWTFNAFVRDISERKRAEDALREREERIAGILRQATVGIAEVDLTGRFVLVNDRFCEIVRRWRDELLGTRMQDIVHPSDLAGYLMHFEKAARAGEEFVIEKRYVRPDGSCFQSVHFDPATGEPVKKHTHQGYSPEGCWSRGLGWCAYGFLEAHRATRRPEFLTIARRAAEYHLRRMPEDGVPFYDYDDPRVPAAPRDSSAAAILASACLGLAALGGDGRFREGAGRILAGLARGYLTPVGADDRRPPGMLLHGCYNLHTGEAPDHELIWGDYFLLEAFARWQGR